MLYYLHTLKQELGASVIRISSGATTLDFNGLLLIESPEGYDPSYFCLCSPETAVQILQKEPAGCLITAGDSPELRLMHCPRGMTLIVTDLSVTGLANQLNRVLFQTSTLRSKLSQSSPYTTKALLKHARGFTEGSYAVLDSTMAFLCDSIRPEDSGFYASLVQDYPQMQDLLLSLSGSTQLPTEPQFFQIQDRIILVLPFYRNADIWLLCTGSASNRQLCPASLILRELCEPLLSARSRHLPNKNISFQLFFSKLMLENGDSDDTLRLLLKGMANPPKRHMRLILIRSEFSPEGNENISLEHLLEPSLACFPGANIAIMPTEIVILISSDTMYCPLPISLADFEQVLEKHRAIAMVGNPFTTIMVMRVTCRQCQRVFPIAMAVRLEGENRCMTFARYTQYNVIDICARSIHAVLGGSDILVLTHPGVVVLTRYDRANGTNLRDVMFYYLMNDRNIAKTSELLFMHRNTTIYKIKKIEELIGESMDDPYLRHNLIFSCLLLRYREQYQKEAVSFSQLDSFKRRRKPKPAPPKPGLP